MPVIEEEPANGMLEFDMSQLTDMPNAPNAAQTGSQMPDLDLNEFSKSHSVCPAHPGIDEYAKQTQRAREASLTSISCLCHGLMQDFDVPGLQVNNSTTTDLPEPDYSRFEDWIPGYVLAVLPRSACTDTPRFIRPAQPCDYCKSKRLVCSLRKGDTGCKSCSNLFRECSLTNSQTLESTNYYNNPGGAFLDTLHSIDENSCRERGTLTGIKPLHSRDNRASGTSTPVRGDDAPGSTKRNGIRFPRHAVKILREWLDVHQAHPYPTEEQKAELERQTELKPKQIADWLANARRRAKATQRARKVPMSPSLRPSTPAIDITQPNKPWEELNPFERWQHSPPENEPAAMLDIANAVAASDLPEDLASPDSYETRRHKGSSNGSGFSNHRAASTTSFETSHASSLSNLSSAANSHGSSHGSFGSFSSSLAGKKDRRRRRRTAAAHPRQLADDKKRIFQCTFCTDTFKSKYDWTRHEKSLHLSLEKWLCAPIGPFITEKASSQRTCVYCGLKNATDDHAEVHNHSACEEKGIDARTFYRKDHLRQHLRLMHNCEMAPNMDAWKSVATHINSRCGFCAQRFTVWQERVDHLTAHFKAGARMAQWKGCRGLDPAVAAQVTNAMPPYLIGIEAASPNPFSASNRNMAEYNFAESRPGALPSTTSAEVQASHTGNTKATCWEILTVRLGKYANEMAAKGTVITDEMLQSHARIILYGSDDSWNQTAADNPEWLDLFKKAHGLSFIPSAVGGQGAEVPEDLETYGDLGLRIPFAVQLQAFNQAQGEGNISMRDAKYEEALGKATEQRRQEVRSLYHQLSKEGVLHDADYRCQHAECKGNVVDERFVHGNVAGKPAHRRWCTYELPMETAKRFATLTGPVRRELALGTTQPATGSIATDTSHRRRGLTALEEMETRDVQVNGCPWIEHDNRIMAARSRWNQLEKLQLGEVDNCPFREQNDRLGDLRDKQEEWNRKQALAKGMQTLIDLEAAETEDFYGPNGVAPHEPGAPARSYLPRHKYVLPEDRAKQFATTTGAWQDAGMMPEAINTADLSFPSIDQHERTSTGAMMEFLGGNVGAELGFARDAATSQIPLLPQEQAMIKQQEGYPLGACQGSSGTGANAAHPHDWFAGTDHWVDESVLMKDLDDLIAASAAAPQPTIAAAADSQVANPQSTQQAGLGMDDTAWLSDAFASVDNEITTATMAPADVAMAEPDFTDLDFGDVFDFDPVIEPDAQGQSS